MKRAIPAGIRLAATVFGLGAVPRCPGTAASLASALVLWPLREYPAFLWPALAATAVVAVWSGGRFARASRRRDPPQVVADEFLGMGLAAALAPGGGPVACAFAFLLFRLFDILKPPPIRQVERLPGGWGIAADDVTAGVLAALCLHLALCLSRVVPGLEALAG